jgi:hypothetical protein
MDGMVNATPQSLYLFTSWSRDLLEELSGSRLVKNFPAFYEYEPEGSLPALTF